MNNLERDWMYERLDGHAGINSHFVTGVNNFIQFACSQQNRMSGDKIKCPCKKYHNIKYMDVETVKLHVPENVWKSWMQLWGDSKTVKKSETNAKNRRGNRAVAAGTHTGGSISIGEHRKRLAVQMGRDPTPSELHLYVHTHGHDGKSFIDERSRIVHERNEEILQEKIESQSDIGQSEAYYQVVGGEKKRRVYGLGSEAKNYYGPNLRVSSSSTPPSISHESAPTTNMNEFMKKLIPTLIDNILPIVVERVQEVVSSPVVPAPATTNGDEVDPSVSDDDHSPSPIH